MIIHTVCICMFIIQPACKDHLVNQVIMSLQTGGPVQRYIVSLNWSTESTSVTQLSELSSGSHFIKFDKKFDASDLRGGGGGSDHDHLKVFTGEKGELCVWVNAPPIPANQMKSCSLHAPFSLGSNYSIHKEKAKTYAPQGTVGSVYKKTDAQSEIRSGQKDAFWTKQERDEEERRRREADDQKRRRVEEEQERKQRDIQAAKQRERAADDRFKSIQQQK